MLLCNMELFLLTHLALPLPLPVPRPSNCPQTEQIKSPQEVTLEGDRQRSVVGIVTTKGLTKIG